MEKTSVACIGCDCTQLTQVKTLLIPCDDNYGGDEVTVRDGHVETTRYYNIETTYQCADCEKHNVMVLQNYKGGVRSYNVLVGEK